MKLLILLIWIVIAATGCVPFHAEGAASISWGDNQKIKKKTETNVGQSGESTTRDDSVVIPDLPAISE